MKKLVILSAVAALAAFGWASVANAGVVVDPAPTCFVDDQGPGFATDEIDVGWINLPDVDAYAVSAWCMDPETGRAKHASVEVEDNISNCPAGTCSFTFLLTDFNGFASMRVDDVCMVTVKALHFPGPNNRHDIGKATCSGALID